MLAYALEDESPWVKLGKEDSDPHKLLSHPVFKPDESSNSDDLLDIEKLTLFGLLYCLDEE